MPPLFTEPGCNMHKPAEICTTPSRPTAHPTTAYRTTPLQGPVGPAKGGFYHDGRFQTLGRPWWTTTTAASAWASARASSATSSQYLKSL